MGADPLRDALARLASARRITPDDTIELRRAIFADMSLTPVEAETIIALDEAALERCPEWDALFCEAITDYVVRQQQPNGYVDDAGADWVIRMIGRDGQVKTCSELELLVHILEAADSVPKRLSAFALAQVKEAVVEGEGPLAREGRLQRGVMGSDEVALLRRILYATAGDGNIAITRDEAETLIDINDAVSAAANDPTWNDLFAKAIGAAVMTVSGYQAVSREDAQRQRAWLERPSDGLGGFFARMFDAGGRRDFNPASWLRDDALDEWDASNRAEEAAMAAAERVTEDEARWLMDRIGRDGAFDDAEKALVDFLHRESPQIHPAFQPLINAHETGDDAPVVFGRRRAAS